jgi:hypothetical protein
MFTGADGARRRGNGRVQSKIDGEDTDVAPEQETRPAIAATAFTWRDPATMRPRQWLYGKHYIRKYITCTVAPGGGGKTSLAISEALAMASGAPLLCIEPSERARVWFWNGEDPREELERRVMAAVARHKLTSIDVEGHLFLDIGREMPIVLATQSREGAVIARPVAEAVIEAIRRNRIDALIIDPFVKSHKVTENDNSAIDAVATAWAHIAEVTNCSIELLHHPRKTGGAEITVEDGRGASALLSASRSARVLNTMSREEARKAGLSDAAARLYFRVENGKPNMVARPERATWYMLESVPLGNGDDVGVVVPWKWPDPFDGVTTNDLRAAQNAVSQGGPWRANHQARTWVGIAIAAALHLDAKRHRARIKEMLDTWIKNGMFVLVEGKGDDRHPTQFIEVGTWAE